jgi:hypothetical protein
MQPTARSSFALPPLPATLRYGEGSGERNHGTPP